MDMLEGENEWVDGVLPKKKEKVRGCRRIESKLCTVGMDLPIDGRWCACWCLCVCVITACVYVFSYGS